MNAQKIILGLALFLFAGNISAQMSESYVPLAIGNIYNYKTVVFTGGTQYVYYQTYTITQDVFINGKRYFYHPLYTENCVRYDSSRQNFLIYYPGYSCDGYVDERKIDSLKVNLNDSIYNCFSDTPQICSFNQTENILGLNLQSVGFYSMPSVQFGGVVKYTKGIGITTYGGFGGHSSSVSTLIGCVINGISYPAIIPVTLDTADSKYFNLNVSNKYIYSAINDANNIKITSVLSDTIINQKKYYYSTYYYGYVRYDSTKGTIVMNSIANCGGYTNDSKLDSLAAGINDTIKYCTSFYYKICTYNEDSTIFNTPVKIKTFSRMVNGKKLSESYAHNFSIIRFDELDSVNNIITYSLRGAVLNGIAYGDTTVPVYSVNPQPLPQFHYLLAQNYPNPFNPSTKINYEIKSSGFVSLKVFNLLGKEVATLVNEKQNPGTYAVDFNSSEFNLPSGIYFYTLNTGDFKETKKMVLVK